MSKNSKVKGLILGFFSFLFFVVLLSGGTQILFSSEKVSGWIRSGLESAELKNFEAKFTSARTTWTGSFRYPFGVKLYDVNIKLDEDCKVRQGEFKSIVIPFSVSAAMKKKIDIGVIKVNEGELTSYNTCLKSLSTNKNIEDKKIEEKSSVEGELLKFFKSLERIETFEDKNKFQISGFLFSDIILFSGANKGNKYSFFVDRMKIGVISLNEYESQWSGYYKVGTLENKTHKVSLKGQIDVDSTRATLFVEGRKKEGVFKLEAKSPFWKKSERKPFVQISFENFPISSLADIFGINLSLPKDKQRASWLDCQVTSSFEEEAISFKSPVCLIKGDLGSYNITSGVDLSWFAGKWNFNKSIDIKISEVSFSDIYPFFGRRGPDGIFGEFGDLSVDLSLVSFDSAYAEFELRDFSILFRSKGVSSFQKGKSARGTGAVISKEKIEFSIEEMDLENGEFEGTIGGNFNLKKGEFDMNFEIPHLVLNPSIGRKLFDVELGAFELEGEGRFNYKESLQDLKIKLGFDEIKSAKWELGQTEVPCLLLNKALDCSFEVASLELSEAVFKKIQLKRQSFSDLTGRLDYYKRSLKVEAFKENSKESLFKAKWSADLGLEGAVRLEDGSFKELNFRGVK